MVASEVERGAAGGVPVSLDVYLTKTMPTRVHCGNITHNLGPMAREAGIYTLLWRPEEIGIKYARELIAPLEAGLNILRMYPERFRKFNPENGWGSYEGLVEFVEVYLAACREHPDAEVDTWR